MAREVKPSLVIKLIKVEPLEEENHASQTSQANDNRKSSLKKIPLASNYLQKGSKSKGGQRPGGIQQAQVPAVLKEDSSDTDLYYSDSETSEQNNEKSDSEGSEINYVNYKQRKNKERPPRNYKKHQWTMPSGGRSSLKWLAKNKPYFFTKKCATCLTDHHGKLKYHSKASAKTKPCPLFNPLHKIEDNVSDRSTGLQSLHTLPKELCVKVRPDSNGLTIYTAEDVKAYTQLGPVRGEPLLETDIERLRTVNLDHVWFMSHSSQEKSSYQYTADDSKSNWCCYLRQTVPSEPHNTLAIAKDDNIFVVSVRNIAADEELICAVPYFGSQDKPYDEQCYDTQCSKCKMDFAKDLPWTLLQQNLSYQKHWWVQHPYGSWRCTLKHICDVCGTMLYSKKHMRQHARSKHGWMAGSYKCPYCRRFLSCYESLQEHQKCKHPEAVGSVANFSCEKCHRVFYTKTTLRHHTYMTHPDNQNALQCDICKKTFSNRCSVMRHRRGHDNSNRSACHLCGKCFRDLSNLRVHMLTHSKVKPFPCQQAGCQAAFTVKHCLQTHYRKVHHYTTENMPKIQRVVPLSLDCGISATTTEVLSRSVLPDSIASDSIAANSIATDSITANSIAADSIAAASIGADSIAADSNTDMSTVDIEMRSVSSLIEDISQLEYSDPRLTTVQNIGL